MWRGIALKSTEVGANSFPHASASQSWAGCTRSSPCCLSCSPPQSVPYGVGWVPRCSAGKDGRPEVAARRRPAARPASGASAYVVMVKTVKSFCSTFSNKQERSEGEVRISLSPISPSPKGMNGTMLDRFNFPAPVPAATLTAARLAAPRMCLRQKDSRADHRQEHHGPPHWVSLASASRRDRSRGHPRDLSSIPA